MSTLNASMQASTGTSSSSNIVFVLTDDQDLLLHSMGAMKATAKLLAQCPTCFNFTQAHVTTPICCPSRASFLTGKYSHNHRTLSNSLGTGCASENWTRTQETSTYATALHSAGYTLGFFGKYLNQYGTQPVGGVAHVPPGWNEWLGLVGNSAYYNYTLSNNGVAEVHGDAYPTDYLTDVLKNRSTSWLAQSLSRSNGPPVALIVHVPAPHRPAQPAPQHLTAFAGARAPRTSSWNPDDAVMAGRNPWLATRRAMNASEIDYSDHLWRRRLRALLSVDELVAALFATVETAGALDQTAFIFTSDHGYHSGQWRTAYCKMLPYAEDVRIPLFVRMAPSAGLGPATGPILMDSPVLNVDLAPTMLELAGLPPTETMDGTSFLSHMRHAVKHGSSAHAQNSGRTFLIEYWPLVAQGNDVQLSPRGQDGWCTDPDVLRPMCPTISVTVDSANNSWACMRRIEPADGVDDLYCRFWSAFSSRSHASIFEEYFDMRSDPWQLQNTATQLSPKQRAGLQASLASLIECAGQSCRHPAHRHSQQPAITPLDDKAPPLVAQSPGTTTSSPPRAAQPPNILFFLAEELRYDFGGGATNPYYTSAELALRVPSFDALAARGTRFSRAIVPSPVCAPSRACLASGREYDAAGQGANLANEHSADGNFDVASVPTFYQSLQRAGYWTMVAGRDDLTKRTGPGLGGAYHTPQLGFNDSARCAGSVDVTWGECGGSTAGAPCAGPFANESQQRATVHEPYGKWLKAQAVPPAVSAAYNVSDYFELDFARFEQLKRRGPYDSVHWYAIPDTLPFEQRYYQDDWIGRSVIALFDRVPHAPHGGWRLPWFLEVSHHSAHPPLDITEEMQASMRGRENGWPSPVSCAPSNELCGATAAQRLRHNYAAKVEKLDALLGAYVAHIAEHGELDATVVVLAADHGEMLADRAATAKSKPWQPSLSVPLVLAGPGIAAGALVDTPVTTLDLAATFVELAGGVQPSGSTSRSLRPLLVQRDAAASSTREPPARIDVHSGLGNFRVVIHWVNASMQLKLVCCNGACPGATAADRTTQLERGAPDELHLFDVSGDAWIRGGGRHEPPDRDLAPTAAPALLRQLAALLPPPNRRRSYSWDGCSLSGWV